MIAPFTAKTGVKVDVQEVGWDVQFDRIRNAAVSGEGPDITQAGTTQVPFFAALGGFNDLATASTTSAASGAYAAGHLEARRRSRARTARGRSRGSPRRARSTTARTSSRRPASTRRPRSRTSDVVQGHAAGDQGQGPGHRAVRRARQEGVRPRPPRHAVRVGQPAAPSCSDDAKKSTINSPAGRRQGVEFMADLIKDGLFDKSQLERDGTQVENQFKGGKLAVWIGGPWVLGSIDRADDENWVRRGAQERRRRADADRPGGQGVHVRRRLGPDDVQVHQAPERGLGADEVPVGGPDAEGLREPARHVPGAPGAAAAGRRLSDANHKAFFEAIQQGRTYAPIPQWGQIENAYKTRFGNILDSAAGVGKATTPRP